MPETETPEKPAPMIPDAHRAAIGSIATWWAHLEFLVDHTTWEVAEVEHFYGACITAQMLSIHPKLRALIALVEVRGFPDALLKSLRVFQTSIGGLVEARNRAIHDPRMMTNVSAGLNRLQITASGNLTFEFKKESVADLEKVIGYIEAKVAEFEELKKSIEAELVSLRGKPNPRLVRVYPIRVALDDPTTPTEPPSQPRTSQE